MGIDFIKLDITHVGRKRLEQGGLTFVIPGKFDPNGGEIIKDKGVRAEYVAEYKGLKFSIFKSGKIELKGSLHKYYNNGKHNKDQFTINKLCWVVEDLINRFGINIEIAIIHHLEYAVNIYGLEWKSKDLVESLMIQSGCRGMPPEPFKWEMQKTKSAFKTTERAELRPKIYDKGLQYNLKKKVFRVETKENKMRGLNKLGIRTLSDLLRPENHLILGDRLIKMWDEVLISDWTIREGELTEIQRNKLRDWRNTNYWMRLYRESKRCNRNKFRNEIKQYNQLIKDHSNNIHASIKQAIIKTWRNITMAKTPFEIAEKVKDHHGKKKELTKGFKLEKVKDHPYINGELAPTPRSCIITGENISAQKPGSLFISKNTLFNHPELLEKYIPEFGPNPEKAKTMTIEMIAYYVAHNIRNMNSNFRKRERTLFYGTSDSLFPFEPTGPIYLRQPKTA